jgi:hypothetical protein
MIKDETGCVGEVLRGDVRVPNVSQLPSCDETTISIEKDLVNGLCPVRFEISLVLIILADHHKVQKLRNLSMQGIWTKPVFWPDLPVGAATYFCFLLSRSSILFCRLWLTFCSLSTVFCCSWTTLVSTATTSMVAMPFLSLVATRSGTSSAMKPM